MLTPTFNKTFNYAAHPKDGTRQAFGKAVVDMGAKDPKVVYLTADGTLPTVTAEFFKQFPERAFNVGIAEQNLVAMAAGMASCGLTPIVGGYAPFLVFRALEQIRNDAAYTKFHVVIAGVYTGISLATGGSTHHTTEDLAMLRSIANMTVMSPADGREAYKATVAATQSAKGPVFIRLGGRTAEPVLYTEDYDFQIGKAVQLREGSDATVIANGSSVFHSVVAADLLREEGIKLRVLNMHTVKPLDEEAILKAAKETGRIITVEEHSVLGGLGGAVAEVVTANRPVPVTRIGIKDIFASIGPTVELLKKYGLTYEGLAKSIKEALSK